MCQSFEILADQMQASPWFFVFITSCMGIQGDPRVPLRSEGRRAEGGTSPVSSLARLSLPTGSRPTFSPAL